MHHPRHATSRYLKGRKVQGRNAVVQAIWTKTSTYRMVFESLYTFHQRLHKIIKRHHLTKLVLKKETKMRIENIEKYNARLFIFFYAIYKGVLDPD
jgi:hypothetical protein